MTYIPESLRRLVYERANERCEYCHLPNRSAIKSHEVDHIRAEKHGGRTDANNLCLSCYDCNHFKGTDLSSVDPVTDEVVTLFDPRKDRWHEHFVLSVQSGLIEARDARGRVTVNLLKMNTTRRVLSRRGLIQRGQFKIE